MSIDETQFRAGMRLLAGGVTIISTEHQGLCVGLTATAVCSLSVDPPRLLACVNRGGSTYACIRASRHLCVNLLTFEQHLLARGFAGASPIGGRFALGDWSRLVSGMPALDGALAVFDCAVAEIVDTGSHGILICDVLAVRTTDGAHRPLVYCNGGYASVEAQLV